MRQIFDKFKIKIVKDSIKRVQMDDATYFGPDYKNHVSNSKLGLLNPAQGGSPQKFFEGFKPSGSTALALGSAVHQLTLESNDYVLSDITSPSGKLGKMYDLFIASLEKQSLLQPMLETIIQEDDDKFGKFIDYILQNPDVEKCLVLACNDADYYAGELERYKGQDIPGRIKSGLSKAFSNLIAEKPEFIENKRVIYLPSDLIAKCKSCTNSLKANKEIQNSLNWENSYCEDVILAELEIQFPKDFRDEFSEMITTIVPIKIKIDNWTIDHEKKVLVLNDLKTTGKPIQYFMGYFKTEPGFMGEDKEVFVNGSWQNFHYHRQMGEIAPLNRNVYSKLL